MLLRQMGGPNNMCVKISGLPLGLVLIFVSLRFWELGRIKGRLPGFWLTPRYLMDFSVPQSFLIVPEGVLVMKMLLWNFDNLTFNCNMFLRPKQPTNIGVLHLSHQFPTNIFSNVSIVPDIQSYLQWLLVFQNLSVFWQEGLMDMLPQNNNPSICLV